MQVFQTQNAKFYFTYNNLTSYFFNEKPRVMHLLTVFMALNFHLCMMQIKFSPNVSQLRVLVAFFGIFGATFDAFLAFYLNYLCNPMNH